MKRATKRRSVLATAGAVAATGTAGCSSLLGDDEPSFEIQNVRVYQPDDQAVFVAPTVEKTGSGDGRLRLEARLVFSNSYDHGHEQEFGVRAEVDEYMYVLPFRWDSPFLADKTYEARANIIGDDAGWVDETERVTSAPETDDIRNQTG